jgi:hypothetical protein
VVSGKVVYEYVAKDWNLPHTPVAEVL